jgi:hypothetical protein
MEFLELVVVRVIVTFMAALGLVVIVKILQGKNGGIDLEYLVSGENGQASLSRFQFLIFTFVIAMGLLVIILEKGGFPEISGGVFGLLGISAGSHVSSKISQKVAKPGG